MFAISSAPVREKRNDDSDLVTEVIVGERVEIVDESGGWLQVVVPDHTCHLDPRGYPGWTRAETLVENPDFTPTHKVVRSNPADLPLGALLHHDGSVYRSPSGEEVSVESEDMLPVGRSVPRSTVELAREFVGLPYRWGGTDSTTGTDCSGLVYRVMQLLGIPVPRDADDQFDHAPFNSRENWAKAASGDLVFFGRDGITHVGFYLGDGTYISEHGAGGTLVRGMEEDPYFGFGRYL